MNAPPTTCADCGSPHLPPRLWCSQCGKPLGFRCKPPDASPDKSIAKRKQLYQQFLKDIQWHAAENRLSPELHHQFANFYTLQLKGIDDQIAEFEAARRAHHLFLSARHEAQSGRFEYAVGLLRRLHSDGRYQDDCGQLIQEINEKNQQREQAIKATRQAQHLFKESVACVERCELAEAFDKLEQAKRLDPNRQEILVSWNRVKDQIEKQENARRAVQLTAELDRDKPTEAIAIPRNVASVRTSNTADERAAKTTQAIASRPTGPSFDEQQDDVPSPARRLIDAASEWSSIIKPFLLDNVGWFVGAFLVVAGFVVLIVSFWGTIQQRPILMHSLVFISLAVATTVFFIAAYFMRKKYPRLESSGNVLLVIVASTLR